VGLSDSDVINGHDIVRGHPGIQEIFKHLTTCLNISMKTFQLTIRINGVELATIIHAANAEQAKLIARSWGARVIAIAEL
jgi:GGDEF domain-containing protein